MHVGVIRDMEQQKLRKERQLDFDMQRALEQEYLKVQTVHDGANDTNPSAPKTTQK
jgi:protein PET117